MKQNTIFPDIPGRLSQGHQMEYEENNLNEVYVIL